MLPLATRLHVDLMKKRFSLWAMHLILASMTCLVWAHQDPLMAEDDGVPYHTLDPVVITASLIPEHLSRVGQSVSVINREDIDVLPADNIADLLETVNGVDIRQRGAHGVQADVAIRGSSFEQTLVLIDGVPVGDSQTGHHNLDLPVNVEDIERIEVLKGPGARIYGQNAMAGVINIITRDVDCSSVGGYGKYGDYDYEDFGAHGAVKTQDMTHRFSVSRRSSAGYIQDTDFDVYTLFYKGTIRKGDHKYQAGLGYTDKSFGAYRFYSDTFPNQRERTQTLLAYSSACFKMAHGELMPKIFWRRHDDDFKIEIESDWYRNDHQTDSYGLQLSSRIESQWGTTAFGGEIAFEDLQSSQLGDHERERSGAFIEHKFRPLERLTLGLGASAMHYTHWGWEYWPGAESSVELTDRWNWFASAGRSFRIPSFTEWYYDTPANQGNPDLKPEHAWTYETGVRWRKKGLGANLGLFLRDAEDVIDWSRVSEQDPWKARNIAESTTEGFELELHCYPAVFSHTRLLSAVHLAYTYLDTNWNAGGLESKYVLDHLRHQVHGSIMLDWFDHLNQTVSARYEKRMEGGAYVIVDTRLTYQWRKCQLFLEATNLFDEAYVESGFVPMPGRWIVGGARFHMDLSKERIK
jgi:vitamin B12 transporter